MITRSCGANSRLPSLSIPCDLSSSVRPGRLRPPGGPGCQTRMARSEPHIRLRPACDARTPTPRLTPITPTHPTVGAPAMGMFLFLVVALAVVVAAVTLAVVGGGDKGPLPEAG